MPGNGSPNRKYPSNILDPGDSIPGGTRCSIDDRQATSRDSPVASLTGRPSSARYKLNGMFAPQSVAISSCQSVRPTVGSIMINLPSLRLRLNSRLPIPLYPTLAMICLLKLPSSAAASGAATQTAVLPTAGGSQTSLRPENIATTLQLGSHANSVK